MIKVYDNKPYVVLRKCVLRRKFRADDYKTEIYEIIKNNEIGVFVHLFNASPRYYNSNIEKYLDLIHFDENYLDCKIENI